MKGAIASANIVTTVSQRYADEICSPEYAHGLDRILRDSRSKLIGILNGIDYNYYAPEKDTAIAVNYKAGELDKKYENKLALQRELGLPERTDVPMIAIISRLASHKGFDIISQMIYSLVGGHDVQLVLLGKGESQYEGFFQGLENAYRDKVRALITYDRDLSKRIYAASDIFLMPSKSEPCGLSQMIASRYGSIPVVRETGGLYDSIKPYWIDNGEMRGNGFTFANYSPYELEERTCAAIELWYNAELRARFVDKIMKIDFSWKSSAQSYLQMYAPLWRK
jgi:starch synthase